jgi:ankyrin repeat protein
MMSVYLTEEIASKISRNLAYYFCVSQDMERNNACAVLRGLLWQITGQLPHLLRILEPHFDPPERGKATVSSEETLWNLFKQICSHAGTERLYCLVDGVDECDEDSMHWLVSKFMSVGRGNGHPKLSLLVLSRPVTGLDDGTCITLDPDYRGQVSADVAKFVQSKVEELSHKLKLDTAFERNAANVLMEKSEGTFLWVGFVMGELLKKNTRSQVEKAMYSLPKGLPAVYARMLHDIEPDDRENSKKLLTCISVAFKPLSLKTLADILGCRSSATISEEQATLDETAVCASMLNIRDKRVEFVHQSAKDYLLRRPADADPVLEEFRIQPTMAHLYLARRCVQSLVEGSWLQHYSLMNWPDHAKHSNDLSSRLFEHEHLFFGKDSLSRDLWWRKYSLQFLGLPKVVPPRLHMACFVGHEAWVRAILTEEQCPSNSLQDVISEECPGGWLALDYGAQRDSGDIVKLLLDVISESGVPGERLEDTLRRAVLAGREVLVQSMLSHGSNVNACDVEGTSLLLHATRRQDKAIMQMLLEHGANPNLSDNDGLRPLEAALRTRRWTRLGQRLERIDLLLVGGADPNAHTHGGQTLLNLALLEQEHDTVRLLLGHGANVTLSRVRSTSALSGDAGTTLPRSRSTSPLPYESHPGDDIGIGKIQRQNRSPMLYHDDRYRKRAEDTEDMSLHIAVALRDDIMVRLLIAGGADVNMRDGAQRTVIHVVTAEQQDSSDDGLPWWIQFLAIAGADVNAKRDDGNTALHILMQPRRRFAAGRYRSQPAFAADNHLLDEILSVLELACADFNARNLEGKTPLRLAAERRDLRSMRKLINSGARWDTRDSNGDTRVATNQPIQSEALRLIG